MAKPSPGAQPTQRALAGAHGGPVRMVHGEGAIAPAYGQNLWKQPARAAGGLRTKSESRRSHQSAALWSVAAFGTGRWSGRWQMP